MPLVKRLIKGSTLTYQEMDDNLSYLDNKVSGSDGYITRFSGSTALTSSLLNQISSTVFVYGSFNVSQSLTVNNSSVVTLASPSYYIATGSVTASVDVNSSKIFSITSASVNFGQINKTLTNTSFGQETLPASATGYGNAAFGYRALRANTSGIANIAIGYGALLSNTDGDENVAIGGNALEFNTLGSYNTAIGTAALDLNNADNNTALGYSSGFSNVTGSNNVFLGYKAGFYETNSNRLYISNSDTTSPLIKGNFSTGLLQLNTAAGTQITGSLTVSGSTTITGSLLITGSAIIEGAITTSLDAVLANYLTFGSGGGKNYLNTAAGYLTLYNNTSGSNNTAVGANSLSNNNIGNSNCGFGQGALVQNQSGNYNNAFGHQSLLTSTGTSNNGFGYRSLANIRSGINNTAIGDNAGYYSSGSSSGNVYIGSYAGPSTNTTENNKLYIANNSGSSPLIKGDFSSGLLQLFTPAGTEITGPLTTTGEINAIGFRGSITISPNYRYISLQDPTDPFGNLVALYLSGSGIVSKGIPYLQLGDLGLNINDQVNILSTGVKITGSLDVSTSASRFVLNPSTKDLSWIDSTDNMNQFSIYLSGSNENRQVLLQSGDKGFNLDDKLKVVSTGTQITGSLIVSGSGATFYNIITLPALNTLPSGSPTGSFAVSGSNANCKPYFYNGSTWTALF